MPPVFIAAVWEWLRTRPFRTMVSILFVSIIATLAALLGDTPYRVAFASDVNKADTKLEREIAQLKLDDADKHNGLQTGITEIRISQVDNELRNSMFAVCKAQQNHNQEWLTAARVQQDAFAEEYFKLHRREYERPPCDQVLIAQGWVP